MKTAPEKAAIEKCITVQSAGAKILQGMMQMQGSGRTIDSDLEKADGDGWGYFLSTTGYMNHFRRVFALFDSNINFHSSLPDHMNSEWLMRDMQYSAPKSVQVREIHITGLRLRIQSSFLPDERHAYLNVQRLTRIGLARSFIYKPQTSNNRQKKTGRHYLTPSGIL